MFNLSRLDTIKSSHIAAIDLGSNSFHMIVAKWDKGQLVVLDRLRESVRLGWGLSSDGSLSDEARFSALNCLEKFGERLREYPSRSVRIVGTKTLRSINDSRQFLAEAKERLGHPVEIISGDEEARLVYLGVAHCVAPTEGRRLVVDIGGGSTEVILGEGMSPSLKESLNMGCVAVTKKFFFDGRLSEKSIAKAHVACLQELEPVIDSFLQRRWNEVLGASGTIKAVARVCEASGFSKGAIRLEYLERIIQIYKEHGATDLKIPGLSEDRQMVFLGGVIILKALFESLQIDEMIAADWALREGLLFDLKGRLENHDIRQASVDALAERFHVNIEKAKRVEATALSLLEQVLESWALNNKEASNLLAWATKLYSVGLDIAHNDYHKHGAYIVQHVDLAGCSRIEQTQLATLVLSHRKRIPIKHFPSDSEDLLRLAIILRLAVIFHRGRKADKVPAIKIKVSHEKIKLSFSQKWKNQHPLTLADLETEIRHLQDVGYEFDLIETSV
jgi:exopolyphosphatase / guanosine-5'-triphosphate,3'-diphosphate pyrophosphatase